MRLRSDGPKRPGARTLLLDGLEWANSGRASEPRDVRRRRISFRAWHRGIRETDLILGRFADAHLGTLTEMELDDFERLLDLPDPDILAWVTGMETAPAAPQSHVLTRIIAFHHR